MCCLDRSGSLKETKFRLDDSNQETLVEEATRSGAGRVNPSLARKNRHRHLAIWGQRSLRICLFFKFNFLNKYLAGVNKGIVKSNLIRNHKTKCNRKPLCKKEIPGRKYHKKKMKELGHVLLPVCLWQVVKGVEVKHQSPQRKKRS